MKLYLLRHGHAKPGRDDYQRPLTESGKKEIVSIADILKSKNIRISKIWHSTRRRAIETAAILAEALQLQSQCEEHEGLGPNDPFEPLVEKINELVRSGELSSLMIVGHLPYLQDLTMQLFCQNPAKQIICFQTGTVLGLDLSPRGIVSLDFTADPE